MWIETLKIVKPAQSRHCSKVARYMSSQPNHHRIHVGRERVSNKYTPISLTLLIRLQIPGCGKDILKSYTNLAHTEACEPCPKSYKFNTEGIYSLLSMRSGKAPWILIYILKSSYKLWWPTLEDPSWNLIVYETVTFKLFAEIFNKPLHDPCNLNCSHRFNTGP